MPDLWACADPIGGDQHSAGDGIDSRVDRHAVWDARVVKGWRVGRGPLLTDGAFTVTIDGVHISGRLSKHGGHGTIRSSKGCFSGDGTWDVRKLKI